MGVICFINTENGRKCYCDEKRKKEKRIHEHGGSNNSSIHIGIDEGPYDSKIGSKYLDDKTTIKKHRTYNNITNSKLKDFLNTMTFQGLEQDTRDYSFNELKKLEQEDLKKIIERERGEFEEKINNIFKFDKIKDSDIDSIIANESTISMIKRKIYNIEIDKSKYSFKHLKIMLVGRKGIGKTDLIYYIFGSKDNKDNVKRVKIGDLEEFSCEQFPYLIFLEYKGIGFDKNSKPDIIGTNIFNYINNLQGKDYNDFVHCIWYCITDTKFEAPEIAVLKKLKNSYKDDNVLPVIVVYTKTESHVIADKMEEHIKNQNIDTHFIKTLSQSFRMRNGNVVESFGRKELLDSTLDKCTKSLQGDLINLMIKKISDEIQKELTDKNNEILSKIQEKIIDKFIKEFDHVKDDGELIDYIINIIVDNIKDFYISKITNKSFNLLNNSDFKKQVEKKVEEYKTKAKALIKNIVVNISIKFLNDQAKIEKQKGNMEIKHKRKLKELAKTSEIFLKKNFYYISQRLMTAFILDNIYKAFFEDFKKKLDKKIKNIFNIKSNLDIKAILEHTFLVKLKDFGDNWGIKIDNRIIEEDIIDIPQKNEVEHDEERQNNNNLITNSFIFINNENNDEKEVDENENDNFEIEQINNNNWFPFEQGKNWKYIKDTMSLNKFLQSLEIQDSYFNQHTDDAIFALFKEDIRKDLLVFFNKKKYEFMRNINNIYLQKRFPFEINFIPKIIEKEIFSSTYDKKIKNEIDIINNNLKEIHIDYITIIVAGRSGIGKSELINALIKEDKAKTDVGFRTTLNNDVYRGNNSLSFLRMIDTRGTELEDVTLDKIVKNTKDVIEIMKSEAKRDNDYNKNVQCIYYCVKGESLEDSEIKAIEEIRKNKEFIPLIVVYTMGLNMEVAEKMQNKILTKLNVPFICVLAKKMGGQESYGLNDLLKLTLDQCQKAIKGNIFKEIKNKICDKVKNNLKKKNESIKYNIGDNILKQFINFRKVLKEDELYEIIYNYLEIAFIEYMNNEQKENLELKSESRIEFKNSKIINDYIKDFIEFYKQQSNEAVAPILDKGSLEFLDMQVKKEKKLGGSIDVDNKNDRESFKKIISEFLNANFYYISQKYVIYRFISDYSESFFEELEKNMNEIVKQNIEKNEAKKLIKYSYDKIFKAFRKTIYENVKDEKIYEEKDDNNQFNNFNKSINLNYNNDNNPISTQKSGIRNDLDCPNPYPSLNYKGYK